MAKRQGSQALAWMEERKAERLEVFYFHIVFTLPAEIGAIAYQNEALICDLLFEASSDTMLTIAADPEHLGAKIAITSIPHTWGSAMTNIHMIVAGGRNLPGWITLDRLTTRLSRARRGPLHPVSGPHAGQAERRARRRPPAVLR